MGYKRKLPDWCKDAKVALIRQDKTVTDLSDEIGISRTYTSQVVNGRVFAPEIAEKISVALGLTVPYSDNIV